MYLIYIIYIYIIPNTSEGFGKRGRISVPVCNDWYGFRRPEVVSFYPDLSALGLSSYLLLPIQFRVYDSINRLLLCLEEQKKILNPEVTLKVNTFHQNIYVPALDIWFSCGSWSSPRNILWWDIGPDSSSSALKVAEWRTLSLTIPVSTDCLFDTCSLETVFLS